MKMSDLPRRTIEELKTRYFCEPDLFDLYVEGEFDQQLITSWCKKNLEKKIVPYEIDTVDIPMELLGKYNLTEGQKQRVITLAKELADQGLQGYKCLVDKDLDHWLGRVEEVPNLLWTDYCSVEAYFFNEALLKRIVLEVSSAKIVDWAVFFNSFVEVLKSLYCLRLTDASMQLSMKWIELDKYISVKNSEIQFDGKLYAERTILQNKHSSKKEQFLSEFIAWMGKIKGDPRLYTRGHDFVKMIAITNKNCKGVKGYQDVETIERLFIALVDESEELIDHIIKSL